MNRLIGLQIQTSNAKKKIRKRNFGRKIRKVVGDWQISTGNHENLATNSVPLSKSAQFNIRHSKKKKSPIERKFRPVDDVARKLLQITSSVNVNVDQGALIDKSNEGAARNIGEDDEHQMTSMGKALSSGTDDCSLKNNEQVDELSEEICDDEDGNSYSEGDGNLKKKKSEVEFIEDDDSHELNAGESENWSNEAINNEVEGKLKVTGMEEPCYFIGNDGNIQSLTPITLDDWEDLDDEMEIVAVDKNVIKSHSRLRSRSKRKVYDKKRIVFDEHVSNIDSSSYSSKFDRYNFTSCFSPHSPAKKKAIDDTPLVVEMAEPAPTPHLIMDNSSSLPFPYTDISNRKQSVEECLKDFTIRKSADCLPSSERETISTKGASAYSFRVLPDDKVLLGLKQACALFFIGKLRVSVLFGCVEVLGFQINSEGSRKNYDLYSPRGVSLLSLSASRSLASPANYSKLAVLGLDSHQIEEIRCEMCDIDCLLLLESILSPLVDFIRNHFPVKLFSQALLHHERYFKIAETVLHCKFVAHDTAENLKLFLKRPEWETCTGALIKSGKIRAVVCGGKSVGKSTFLRFLVNKHLAQYKEVLYLDFDPGQSEFTVPGCVSVVLVREPLLGPNYVHLHTPLRMVYVGEINMSRCPARYLQCVQHIIEFCHSQPQFSGIPWFINTMGFSKGLGVELTVNVIRMVGPSDVIQIQSCQKKRNFPQSLQPSYVCDYQSTLASVPSASYSDLAYNLYELPSAAEELQSEETFHWGLEANKLRDLVILSYLSQILLPSQKYLTEVVPFRLPFSKLKLCICHEAVQYSQYLAAMNCNLVALCSVGDEDTLIPSNPDYPQILLKLPVCPCYGFGIVRGVDVEAKVVYLISPISETALSQVNCLVLGPVTVPSGVFFATKCVNGQIPYVSIGDSQPIGQNLRQSRSVAQLNKKRLL